MARYKQISEIEKLMWNRELIRNIGIIAHVDHGKTTLTDSLVAGAGIISFDLAGDKLFTDSWDLEQDRGITVNSANVSLVHGLDGKEHLINLIDTPGHVDFSGDVTRALRAIDGVVIVVDAVEGVMTQTETVTSQALRERARPTLFINKVDRLIKELKLTPEKMQEALLRVISKFNGLIKKYAPEEFKKKWQVNPQKGTVSFGSALHRWAISFPYMKKKNMTLKNIMDYYFDNKQKELGDKLPLYEALLDMAIAHLPNPIDAQKIRIDQIWKGDLNSDIAKSMIECRKDGKIVMVVTDVIVDEHAGVIATGRVFSGTLERGKEIQMLSAKAERRIQQVGIYMGPDRVMVKGVPAGNLGSIVGVKEAKVGETIVEKGTDMVPFEDLKYVSEPVVTVAVEPKKVDELPKLIKGLRKIGSEDPNIFVKIDEDTGEYLISGMGELHLEITQYRLQEQGIEVETSPPIVVYRETVRGKAGPVEGKSPNKHNKIYIKIEPLEMKYVNAIKEGKFSMNMDKKERARILRDLGMPKEEIKGLWDITGGNMLLDISKGVLAMREIKELIIQAVHDVFDEGLLCREPSRRLKIYITDAKLHEDSIHRGPAQIIPAVRSAVKALCLMADPTLLEPVLRVEVRAPEEYVGSITHLFDGRRGAVLDIEQEESTTIVKGNIPVAESFGISADLRSASEGRAVWATQFEKFDYIPRSLQEDLIRQIRRRKGLNERIKSPQDLLPA